MRPPIGENGHAPHGHPDPSLGPSGRGHSAASTPVVAAQLFQHLPRQGDHLPWLHGNDCWVDKDELPRADLEDETLQYR